MSEARPQTGGASSCAPLKPADRWAAVTWLACARQRAEHLTANATNLKPTDLRGELLEADRELGRALRRMGERLDPVTVDGYLPPDIYSAVVAAVTRAHASIVAASRYLIDKNVDPALASIHVARHHFGLAYSHALYLGGEP